jgi:hypothetical protein
MRCSPIVALAVVTLGGCVAAAASCSSGESAGQPQPDAAALPPEAAAAEAEAASPPAIPDCLDGGLLERKPAERSLRSICGIASNPGDMPLGADTASSSLRRGYFDAALGLGGVMIRRDFLWQQIEPARGQWSFDAYDALVQEANGRGVRLLGSLLYGATWANPAAKDEYYPPSDPADFAEYARAVAARYAGRVAAWEIWNEPNNGWRFWKGAALSGDPAAYADLLIGAHAAAREADPATPVLLGGTVFTPQLIEGAISWLEKAYQARPAFASAFEVAGIHTYMIYPPLTAPERVRSQDVPLVDKIRAHACLLASHDAGTRPMWITEIGWPVYDKVDEAAQARYLVRATILAAWAGAEGIFWYTLRDGPHPSTYPPEDAFGLLHNDADPGAGKDATPKPAYTALKALLAVAGDLWPTTDKAAIGGMPADGHAVAFRNAAGRRLVALWTVETAAASVTNDEADGDLVAQTGASLGAVGKGAAFEIGPDVRYVVVR